MQGEKTNLISSGEIIEKVKIRRGIFQADSLPPLLFVIYTTTDPLLRELNKGYIIGNTMVNHQLFMDDLKLFGKKESQVESLVNTVHTMSKDLEWSLVFKNAGCWFWRELRWLDVKDLATQQENNK